MTAAAEEFLDVVDDDDQVIGQETRLKIHQLGLKHRQVHVLFMMPDGAIIFQRRPSGKLDATVGGHVGAGDDYVPTALREVQEETGLILSADALIPLGKVTYDEVYDHPVKPLNKGFMWVYGHIYRGPLAQLQMQDPEEKGATFEAVPVAHVYAHNPELAGILPHLVGAEYLAFYRRLQNLL